MDLLFDNTLIIYSSNIKRLFIEPGVPERMGVSFSLKSFYIQYLN